MGFKVFFSSGISKPNNWFQKLFILTDWTLVYGDRFLNWKPNKATEKNNYYFPKQFRWRRLKNNSRRSSSQNLERKSKAYQHHRALPVVDHQASDASPAVAPGSGPGRDLVASPAWRRRCSWRIRLVRISGRGVENWDETWKFYPEVRGRHEMLTVMEFKGISLLLRVMSSFSGLELVWD